jgi:hypothetical protein
VRLAEVLGSDGLDSSGTLAWAGGALATLGFGLGAARRSALCVLLVIGLRPSRPLPPAPSNGEARVFEMRSQR